MNNRKSILQRGVSMKNTETKVEEDISLHNKEVIQDTKPQKEEIKLEKEETEMKPKIYNNSILGEILKDTNMKTYVNNPTYQETIDSKELSSTIDTLISMGTSDIIVADSGYDLIVSEFNKHLPLFTNYLHKEFRFVDEAFIYFYTDDIIFYGNRVTRSPLGVKITDLLLQIIVDIFGFNKLHKYVSKDVEMGDKYKTITHQLTADLANIYANSLISHHQNRYLINDELARKVLQYLRKLSRDIYTEPRIISRHILDCFGIICEGVDNSFELDTMDYNLPIKIEIEDNPSEPKFKYTLTLEEIDYDREYYYERLQRYLSMTKVEGNHDKESNKDIDPNINQSRQEQEEGQGEQEEEIEGEEDIKEEINKSIENFNNIGAGYSLQKGEQGEEKQTLIEIIDSPQLDWTSRLKEWIEYCKPKKVISYSTPNRKLLYTGMILSSSGNNNQKVKQGLTIYIDTSTSIDMEKIKKSITILKSILSTYKGNIVLKTFTKTVNKMNINLTAIRTNKMNLNLGGGTDIRAVIEDIENSKTKEYINIILTDGEIDWGAVEKAVNKKYKMAFLLTKPLPNIIPPRAKNIKIYEVV